MPVDQIEVHNQFTYYVKTWALLMVLLIVSVLGSMSSMRWVVLAAAFGVAGVKAYLVARNFMHITVEKRWVLYLLLVCVCCIVMLFAGVSPDVMKHDGLHRSNDAAKHTAETESRSGALKRE